MKKIGLLFSVAILSLFLIGCGSETKKEDSKGATQILKVAATPVPHGEILNQVKPVLEKQGVKLEIIEFSDYVRPNIATAEKEVDANFFQHKPYLEKFIQDRNLKLIDVASIHIEPMGIYSKKLTKLADLQPQSSVVIPNDPTNGGRALAILETAGLIKLKEGSGVHGTVRDIVENPKNLKITEIEAAQLPRSLDDVTLAVINMNYALEAGLNPGKDALFLEAKDSPYANILVIRPEDKERPEIKKLIAALKSPEIKKFIQEKYKGEIIPTF